MNLHSLFSLISNFKFRIALSLPARHPSPLPPAACQLPTPSLPHFHFSTLLLCFCLIIFCLFSAPAAAQFAQAPLISVDEECVAFAFSNDGRIVYAVRRVYSQRRWELQRDDIWVVWPDGKRKRIVDGQKLVKSPVPFSYSVQFLRWSPDGTKLTAQLATSQVVDERGNTQDSLVTLLLDDAGKEIRISGADSIIPEGVHATWLADGVSVVYLTETVKPGLLYSMNLVRPVGGRGMPIFDKSTFVAVAWDAKRNAAIAVERNETLAGPPTLVWLDIPQRQRRELATLDAYLGLLSLSPSGKRVAWFRDQNTLEVRDLSAPEKTASTVKIPYGAFDWSGDETRILLRRGQQDRLGDSGRPGSARRSGDLLWVNLADGKLESVLSGLTYRDFALSPDGKLLAVTEPGKRALAVYPVP